MHIIIATPAKAGSTHGNWVTASRWSNFCEEAGHRCQIVNQYSGEPTDLLVALHAKRSHAAIKVFSELQLNKPIILILTGTDIYDDIPQRNNEALDSLARASAIVCLQKHAMNSVPNEFRPKSSVIYQSTPIPLRSKSPQRSTIQFAILSHLRDVKQPLIPAQAARQLARDSKIQIIHAGQIIEPKYEALAAEEMKTNSRYQWLGALEKDQALRLLGESDALIVPSLMEGGANCIAEAIVQNKPVLASRVSGNIGMLGEQYPGYFEVGNAADLCEVMKKFERSSEFRASLVQACAMRADYFSPATEATCIQELIDQI